MFESLTEKLSSTFKEVTGRGKLNVKNIKDAVKEIRLALLEADVNYKIVKKLVADIHQRAIGKEVLDCLTPGQQLIKIVKEELIHLLGDTQEDLSFKGKTPHSLMLVGLQGSGKTTTAAKLAIHLRKQGKRPYLVPADIYRPAAIDQLQTLGKQIDIPVYPSDQSQRPEDICYNAFLQSGREGTDVLIIDTAGRLHIDDNLMLELERIKDKIQPNEILLVADAMTGQDAINVAEKFNEKLEITGIVLSKMEGDARGGAALSIRAVTDIPIKFIGVGEKVNALELFHPDRMASKILGMGDVFTLIEKAQQEFDQNDAQELVNKLKKNKFNLEDFQTQLKQIKKLGSMEQILNMLPGMGQLKKLKQLKPDEKELVRVEAVISSMTQQERLNYKIINGSRRKRIAKGSGTSVQDVNRLLKNFVQTKKMMEKITKKGVPDINSLFH